jgi:hypothetical protein
LARLSLAPDLQEQFWKDFLYSRICSNFFDNFFFTPGFVAAKMKVFSLAAKLRRLKEMFFRQLQHCSC